MMPERIGTEGLGGSCEEEERERLEKQACGMLVFILKAVGKNFKQNDMTGLIFSKDLLSFSVENEWRKIMGDYDDYKTRVAENRD